MAQPWNGLTYREVFDDLFDYMNEHATDKLSAWIYYFDKKYGKIQEEEK